MARKPRFTPPGYWYHLTQRGNCRQQTFFKPADYTLFLELLAHHAGAHQVSILGYALMPNHIHLIAQPATEHALSACLGATTGQYAQHLHARLRRKGHFWQGRFFSCLLGSDAYLETALRYVELNPVRAKMVDYAEQYAWSSAAAHTPPPDFEEPAAPSIAIAPAPTDLLDHDTFTRQFPTPADWQRQLCTPVSRHDCTTLRAATFGDRILGPDALLDLLESRYQRPLRPQPPGRPRKQPQSESPAFTAHDRQPNQLAAR